MAADALEEAADGLAGVRGRRMFGHATLFRGGQIFALLADGGRIGVRLPDAGAFREAMALDGATSFDPQGTGKGMAHWVVLPALLLDEPEAVRAWVRRAHALAGAPVPGGGTRPR